LSQNEKNFSSYFVRSEDGGLSWSSPVVINPKGDETCLLQIKGEEWMAAARESNRLVQYRSNDNGKTWHAEFDLTLPGQVTGHLTRLKDGKILLSYGNRNTNNCGVDIRISEDDGKNWGAPCRLANLPLPDCGYPSTVQLPDESLVTIYYAKTYNAHKYDMYSLKWKISYL
jgi:Neuraminidase (sialidase)